MSGDEMTQSHGVDFTETRAASHYCELSNTGFVTNTQILSLFRPSCSVTTPAVGLRDTHTHKHT